MICVHMETHIEILQWYSNIIQQVFINGLLFCDIGCDQKFTDIYRKKYLDTSVSMSNPKKVKKYLSRVMSLQLEYL